MIEPCRLIYPGLCSIIHVITIQHIGIFFFTKAFNCVYSLYQYDVISRWSWIGLKRVLNLLPGYPTLITRRVPGYSLQ